jgi:hypothetical protein
MRAGLGLVSILVAIGLIAWMMGKGFGTSALTDPGVKHQTANAEQFAGYGRDGEMRFSASLTLDPQTKNGKTTSVLVTSVATGGPAETVFGLKKDDAITEIGPLPVDQIVQSDSDAMAFVQDAYQKMQTLTVIRNGQKITLSAAEAHNKPNTAANSPAQTNSAQSKTPNSNSPLGDQIDLTSPTR